MELIVVGITVVGAVVLALVIVLVVLANGRERARQEALARWATQAEFSFVRTPAVDWWRRLPGRNPRGVMFALSGALNGRPVTIAEYYYTTSSPGANGGTTRYTHRLVLTVARLRRPAPSVAVHRHTAMSKLGRAMFGNKSTAIGYEPFDSAYRVVAADPRSVRGVLGRTLVAEHLAGRLPDWSVEGYDVLCYRAGRIGDPATVVGQLTPVQHVADLLDADTDFPGVRP